MMNLKKHTKSLFAITIMVFIGLVFFNLPKDTANKTKEEVSDMARKEKKMKREDRKRARLDYFFNKLKDPATNSIPPNVRGKELLFAKEIQGKSAHSARTETGHGYTWAEVGPLDVGGRTRALGIDRRNSNIVITGGVSGGIWKSTDKGANWKLMLKNMTYNTMSITSIVQDQLNPDIWYASTGEAGFGDTGKPSRSYVYGGGLYKSTDNGENWNLLTYSVDPSDNEIYLKNSVNAPEIEDSNYSPFAATTKLLSVNNGGTSYLFLCSNYWGIWFSWDGGNTFYRFGEVNLGPTNQTLTLSGERPYFSDLVITNSGNVLIWYGPTNQLSGAFYLSTDGGNSFSDITPSDYNAFVRDARGVLALAPSNDNIMYSFIYADVDVDDNETNYLYKFEFDFPNNTYSHLNRSANLPTYVSTDTSKFDTQTNYNMALAVHPTNPDLVVLGYTNLVRSFDGFATPLTNDPLKSWIGGYDNFFLESAEGISWMDKRVNHPDQHVLIFDPNNPNSLWTGHDGGLSMTQDITTDRITWEAKNNGYNVTQYYEVSIARSSSDFRVIGGTQDNGTPVIDVSSVTFGSALAPYLTDISSGDGAYCYAGNNFDISSSQNGRIKIYIHGDDWYTVSYLKDLGYKVLFIHPFAVDPLDETVFSADSEVGMILRNKGFRAAAESLSFDALDNSWEEFSLGYSFTPTAIKITEAFPANRLYVGGLSGTQPTLLRWDNANTSTSAAEIVKLPLSGVAQGVWMSDIAINPTNGNELLLVFSNYNITGIFHSADGGQTITAVEGNLGNADAGQYTTGPSIRAAEILIDEMGNQKYVVATSVGVYSTSTLNGASTVWAEETPLMSGVVVETLDSRLSDNTLVAGTYGRGAYMARYDGHPNLLLGSPSPTLTKKSGGVGFFTADTVVVSFTVINGGKKDITSNIDVSFFVQGTEIEKKQIQGPLAAQDTLVLEWTMYGPLVGGVNDYSIKIDPGNTILEADDGDNSFTFSQISAEVSPLSVDFMADSTDLIVSEIVAERKVVFKPHVLGGVKPYSYSWTFQGGAPQTGTTASPEIIYQTPGSFDVSLSVTDAAGTTLTADKASFINVSFVTGSLDPKQPHVLMYPNPAHNKATISGLPAGANTDVKIFNMQGQLVPARVVSSNEGLVLDLAGVTSGIYFVSVRYNNRMKTFKLRLN